MEPKKYFIALSLLALVCADKQNNELGGALALPPSKAGIGVGTDSVAIWVQVLKTVKQ